MGSKSNQAHYSSTALLVLLSIIILFIVPPVVAQPNVALGVGNGGMVLLALTSYVINNPISNNILHTSTPLVPAHPAAASTCSGIFPDIRACQSQGVKVFLSVNGSFSSPDPADAQQASDFLWNTFLGGHSITRPFGDAVFDGIIFEIDNISGSSAQFWTEVATSLKAQKSEKKVYLSAAVPCLLSPDAHIETGLFDYVWVRFYNNPECEFGANADALLGAWNQWTTHVSSSSYIFLGLPAAPGAARSGYIPPNVLISSVLPVIKTSPRYGGVMLWNTFFDQQTGYTAAIIHSV